MANNTQFRLRNPRGVFVADPVNPYNHAEIVDAAMSGDAGLVVHDPRLDDVVTCLRGLAEELRAIRFQLNLLTEFEA